LAHACRALKALRFGWLWGFREAGDLFIADGLL